MNIKTKNNNMIGVIYSILTLKYSRKKYIKC